MEAGLTLTITKTFKTKSKHAGDCYLMTFKDAKGKNYRTWLYPECGNFARWKQIMEAGPGTVVGNLALIGTQLVNADSYPKIVRQAEGIIPQVKKDGRNLFTD